MVQAKEAIIKNDTDNTNGFYKHPTYSDSYSYYSSSYTRDTSEPGKIQEIAHISQEMLDEIVEKAPNEISKKILSYALSKEGMPYSQPDRATHRAYDCSSLVYYACCNAGFNFGVGFDAWPPTAAAEEQYCQDHGFIIGGIDDIDKLEPGDIIFYTNGIKVCHVAIYCGDGKMIHAANEKVGVVYQGLYTSYGGQWIKSISRIRIDVPKVEETEEETED